MCFAVSGVAHYSLACCEYRCPVWVMSDLLIYWNSQWSESSMYTHTRNAPFFLLSLLFCKPWANMAWMFGNCVTLENEFTLLSLSPSTHHRLEMRWHAILEVKVMTMRAVPRTLTRSFETSRSPMKSAMLLWVLLLSPSSVLPLPLSRRNATSPSRSSRRWHLPIAGLPPRHLPVPCPAAVRQLLPAPIRYSTTPTLWPAAVATIRCLRPPI